MFLRYENLSSRTGKINTKTMRIYECDKCGAEDRRNHFDYLRMCKKPLFDKEYCRRCWRKMLNNRPEYKAKMSKAIQKMLIDDPDWKRRNSESKKGKINLGSKNGMARPENQDARDRVSQARREYYADPKNREQASKIMRDQWASGKYDNVAVGKCKWFEHTDWRGNDWKLQGTWELAYAKHLDAQRIAYKAHRGRIPYVDADGNERSYYPDFVLEESGEIVDIKNEYHYRLNESKFDMIRKSNLDKKITLLFKRDLRKMGIDV